MEGEAYQLPRCCPRRQHGEGITWYSLDIVAAVLDQGEIAATTRWTRWMVRGRDNEDCCSRTDEERHGLWELQVAGRACETDKPCPDARDWQRTEVSRRVVKSVSEDDFVHVHVLIDISDQSASS